MLGLSLFGCGSGAPAEGGKTAEGAPSEKLTGKISIDGSSTVSPISEALAEEFMREQPGVDVTVATSGTGGGFKKFAAGETDIAGASRPIEEKEVEAAKANGIEFVELPVAFDGLSVVVNPQNDFVDTLTVEQLKRIWEPNSKVTTWADVNPAWPAEKIKLYGAGTDSGTFDYFTKAIVGEEKASRTDYQASEDDNVLVQGVNGDKFSLGYFGYAYFEQNVGKLKVVKIDPGTGGVAPSPETIADGTYQPLSRPLFWYINRKALDRPEVAGLIKFLTTKGSELIASTGYVPLPREAYDLVQKHADEKKTGSLFRGAEVGVRITDILSRERANP